jgi:uncharacterized protein (DUF1330 family)
MSVFMIARLDIKDEAKYFSDVRPKLLDLVGSCGGVMMAATMHAKPIIGEPLAGNRTVIVAFPDVGCIESWVEQAKAVQAEHHEVYEVSRLAAVPESDEQAASAALAE